MVTFGDFASASAKVTAEDRLVTGSLSARLAGHRGDFFPISGLCACAAGAWLLAARHGLQYCAVRGVKGGKR